MDFASRFKKARPTQSALMANRERLLQSSPLLTWFLTSVKSYLIQDVSHFVKDAVTDSKIANKAENSIRPGYRMSVQSLIE